MLILLITRIFRSRIVFTFTFLITIIPWYTRRYFIEVVLGILYTVGCQGVELLGRLVPGFPLEVPLKVNACKSFLFTVSSLKVENKEH